MVTWGAKVQVPVLGAGLGSHAQPTPPLASAEWQRRSCLSLGVREAQAACPVLARHPQRSWRSGSLGFKFPWQPGGQKSIRAGVPERGADPASCPQQSGSVIYNPGSPYLLTFSWDQRSNAISISPRPTKANKHPSVWPPGGLAGNRMLTVAPQGGSWPL